MRDGARYLLLVATTTSRLISNVASATRSKSTMDSSEFISPMPSSGDSDGMTDQPSPPVSPADQCTTPGDVTAAETETSSPGTEAGGLEIIAGYKVHPLASRFDLIEGDEFEKFVEAAERSGRLYPVETHKGFLIDGRNRVRVQEELRRRGIEIEVPVVEWEPTGDETVEEHIWSVNANRRHLTADQRAVLALEFLPAIRAARQARQEASRFGKNWGDAAAVISPPPDGHTEKPLRTSAKKDAASTVGGLAALAGVSNYKANLAMALFRAVEDGEASETEIEAVASGDKRLHDVVPCRKKGGRKKAQQEEREEVDEEELIVESAPVPSEAEARRRWELETSDFAIADLPEWRRLFMKVIGDDQQRHDR
jgi:hypothetical protein